MKLAIVIVHYNTSGDLARCLESLAAYPPRAEHRVVVVDNASADEGLADVHRRFPDCDWVFNAENAGYARGCNLGMARVAAEYHLLLNPDVVVQPGALDALLAFADRQPRAGIVGPQLLNEDGSVQDSCRRFYTFGTLLLRRTFLGRLFPDSETVRRHLMHDFDHASSRPVDWILGGCLLARSSAVARTGPMDERFFLYFEDVDWCYRMWRAGFEVQYTPDARFVHRHRRSSAQGRFGKSFWLHLGSLISFYEKWGMLVWLLKKWREPLLLGLLWALDMVGTVLAFGLAYALRGALGGLFSEPLFPFAEYRPLLGFALLLTSATFLLSGRYRPEQLRRRRTLAEHGQQVGVVAVLLLAATYLGHLDVVSRAVLLLFIPIFALLTLVGERLVRAGLRRLERGGLSLERTLLVGAPAALAPWLGRAGDLAAEGVDVAGYLADPGAAAELPPLAGGVVPWLGRPDDAAGVVERYRISQVAFAELPRPGGAEWLVIGALRRLRVRLRWLGEGVWLLAAAVRAETFGGDLSAVQSTGGRRIAASVVRRLAGLVTGLLLGVAGLPAEAWLRLAGLRGGSSPRVLVAVGDAWGHALDLPLVTDGQGRVRSLPWQWRLSRLLITGRMGLWGSHATPGAAPAVPTGGEEILDFWRQEPAPPGLTGAWAASGGTPGRRFADACGLLWRDPGGLGNVGDASGPTAAGAAPEVSSEGEKAT